MIRIKTTTEEMELVIDAARQNAVCATLLREEGGTPVFLEVHDSNNRPRKHRRAGAAINGGEEAGVAAKP